MGKITIIATFEAAEGAFDELLMLIKEHAQRCREWEPDCLRFDIMVPREEGNRIILYEIYKDQAALDAHLKSKHMEKFRESRTPFFNSVQASTCDLFEH